MLRRIVSVGVCGMLAACSGGGGSGTVNTPPVTPTLAVTLAPSAASQSAPEANSSTSFTVTATYSGSASTAIVPVFTYDSTLLQLDGAVAQSGSSFTAKFKTASGLSAQTHSSDVSFKLCTEAACQTVYPGSSQKFTYSLEVKLSDWTTRQRNAAHNGYVHAQFDPAKFVKAWEFAPARAEGFKAVSARQGTVFVTESDVDRSKTVLALDGITGVEKWRYSLGNMSDASGPALADGQLAISSMFMSSSDNPLVILNADNGQFVRNLSFASQWSIFAQPTMYQGSIYIAAGDYGNVVYGFDLASGTRTWLANGSGGRVWDGEAPAVDDRYVYYYSGNLDVIDRATGARVKSITDPFWVWNGYSYTGTPMLGSDNHVIAYSGSSVTSNLGTFPLVDYDIEAGTYRWRTASGYSVIPAVAKGVIYAASNQTSRFDAIDEATGAVLWSWNAPAGQTFGGNIVITDTLAFVSTGTAVYAIALDGTHEAKWQAGTPGWLAISPDAKLIVTSLPTSDTGKVVAYSLR